MRWEEMTSKDFKAYARKCGGVCVLAISCLEKHGDHLPLGTDMLQADYIMEKAAAKEPVVVFPQYYFGQINCARHCPGTIAIRHQLLLDLLENVCDEISRNGLKKIIIYDFHGGNNHFLQFFAQILLEKERDYVVYVHRVSDKFIGNDSACREIMESKIDGHGGEIETSLMLASNPELVKMDSISSRATGMPLRRLRHMPPNYTGIWWYADYPNHYAGEGKYGTKAKGERIVENETKILVELIKAVKKDKVAPKLTKEFYRRAR